MVNDLLQVHRISYFFCFFAELVVSKFALSMDAAKSSAALSHWDVPVGVVDSCSLYVCVAGENSNITGTYRFCCYWCVLGGWNRFCIILIIICWLFSWSAARFSSLLSSSFSIRWTSSRCHCSCIILSALRCSSLFDSASDRCCSSNLSSTFVFFSFPCPSLIIQVKQCGDYSG